MLRFALYSKFFTLLFAILLITGCSFLPRSTSANNSADTIAKNSGFKKSYIKTKHFTFTSYSRVSKPGEPIGIYIEGDGNAWLTRKHLSSDPSPRDPLVLKLAGLDYASNVAYLARPGQYTKSNSPLCPPSYWSNKRFSPEVIESMNEAIDKICKESNSNIINLIGYSGGAAIAVLIASRRNDVASIRTIAGNLDPESVNKYHNVSALEGSLNPIDVAPKIKDIPQIHFIGSKDTVIPVSSLLSFAEKSGDKDHSRIRVIKDLTHSNGWVENWQELLSTPIRDAKWN